MSNAPQSSDTSNTLLRKILTALNSSVAGIPDTLSAILTDIQTKAGTTATNTGTTATNTGTTATNTGTTATNTALTASNTSTTASNTTTANSLLTSIRTRLVGGVSGAAATQARVTVNGNNVSLLAAASGVVYRDVQIQNLGTVPVFIRLAASADNTGANGEFVLSAGASANDGTGGVYRVSGMLGVITGASTASAAVSVTVINLE